MVTHFLRRATHPWIFLLPLLLSACANAGTEPGPESIAATQAAAPASFEQSADDAYAYALPLFELAAARKAAFDTLVQQPNVFTHRRMLSNAQSRTVTTPNADTLYSSAWLLLTEAPLQIDIPASGARYFSLALMDFYSNNIDVLGTRRDGGVAKRFWIAPPGWQGSVPAGVELIRSPTRSLWALGRTYVRDQADLPAAWAVQNQLHIAAVDGGKSVSPPASVSQTVPGLTDWEGFFDYADWLLAECPLPAASAALTRLGLGTGHFDAAAFSASEREALAAGAQRAYQRASSGSLGGTPEQGWVYPKPGLGDFGSDYGYRATVALVGLGALPLKEAVYVFGAGDTATPQRYDGNQDYTLRFPSGQLPPARAFWSVTLYQPEANGNLFFYDNEQKRYAIGDRTPDLVYGSDGSLTLHVGHRDPGGQASANWLPAPAGPFALVLRAYLPDASLVDGRYRLPAVLPQ
ncbi:MAG: hypothetical protein JWQ90_4819 [Hydrocarboniphaga sp.]|uniref:DUF1254 domain-containing protein n=1 Tax=Hydrocarboniphaga sp. TaxID=2033016 RepID=UPI0026261D9B|nr:DUF1254 domain-containing protein [Hydrocarboniphaga sp.]MDB5972369.1 hypothetical protein [Hydrocarboniphaga sp.]